MRLAGLKKIGHFFHAFDRYNYAKMIPIHLNQIAGLPEYILRHFQMGGFATSITGTNYSCVAADECHECTINKDTKAVITRSPPLEINKLVRTLQFQARVMSNYFRQLCTLRKNRIQRDYSHSLIKYELKLVLAYASKFERSFIFDQHEGLTMLYKAFSKQQASKDIEKDLMNYGKIGFNSFNSYVKTSILRESSISEDVVRKKNLHTFAVKRITKTYVRNLEKEKKLVTLCHKRSINLLKGGYSLAHDNMQILETPRAICTVEGIPNKGVKSGIYKIFRKRYTAEEYQPIVHKISPMSNCCLIAEGMNLIYRSPIGCKTFRDYAVFLVNSAILPFINKGYKDVRILFDQAGTQGLSPKVFEQKRRDNEDADGRFDVISDEIHVPKSWQAFLKTRRNKHLLCNYLFHKFIALVQPLLMNSSCEKFVVSGGFHRAVGLDTPVTMCVTSSGVSPYVFQTNHEESDTQIFLHVIDTTCTTIHIRSVDRDIAMVGLPLFPDFKTKHVFIEFRQVPNVSYLNLNTLHKALTNDEYLASLAKGDIGKILQTLYICSGCDFVSYFAKQGKGRFYRAFFQHAGFISGSSLASVRGSLACTSRNQNQHELGMLAFYRLVGTVYFLANKSSLSNSKYDKPEDLFHACESESTSLLDQHRKFLDIIREHHG
ncbi:uncharacterized protein [Amphiura filiformis]|uniref:uncharacterized protein n=1 Tax=Amphiura filiformis TaxID=82378 RepID=UPI003B21E0AC